MVNRHDWKREDIESLLNKHGDRFDMYTWKKDHWVPVTIFRVVSSNGESIAWKEPDEPEYSEDF
jgi:hypothetical protein